MAKVNIILLSMESDFILKATDKEAQTLYNSQLATVKLMEFKGDKLLYPEMNLSSSVIHKWKVKLRHREDIGELKGTYSYARLMSILKNNSNG